MITLFGFPYVSRFSLCYFQFEVDELMYQNQKADALSWAF